MPLTQWEREFAWALLNTGWSLCQVVRVLQVRRERTGCK